MYFKLPFAFGASLEKTAMRDLVTHALYLGILCEQEAQIVSRGWGKRLRRHVSE